MSVPSFDKNKDITEAMVKALKFTKDSIDMNYPIARDMMSTMNQTFADTLRGQEDMMNAMDQALESVAGLPCNKEVFMDFMKLRDMQKEFISSFKIKLEMDKRLLEILDRFLFVVSKL